MNRTRLLCLASGFLCTILLTGCVGWDWTDRDSNSTTPLVQFLYGDETVPPHDASVRLQPPIRVGLSFLPSTDTRTGALPTAAQRARVLQQIREEFRGLPYVAEIVIIPDYYLDARRGKGLDQMQQLSRLYKLDLYALASYDIVTFNQLNKAAFAYLTIVGQFFVPGDTNSTQTLIDLAVIEPASKQLVLRAGGTSEVKGVTSVADMERTRHLQLEKGLQLATDQLLANFSVELADFENRVRAGTAPVTVAKRGGGSLDLVLLAALALTAALRRRLRSPGARASRRTLSSANARW
jgi:rhombotail lipoprotein